MELTPSLRKIQLTGSRRGVRNVTAWVLAALAAIAAFGYLLPAHRLAGEWHSNYADGGPFSLAVLVLVVGVTLSLRHRKLGSGMLTGALATAGAVAAATPVMLVHLFSEATYGVGESVFAIGEVGLLFGGIFAFVAEPVLYVLERRGMVRARTPRLPRAVALA